MGEYKISDNSAYKGDIESDFSFRKYWPWVAVSVLVLLVASGSLLAYSLLKNSPSTICEAGTYNKTLNACIYPIALLEPEVQVVCPENYTYNENNQFCEFEPKFLAACPQGAYNSTENICQIYPTLNYICPQGIYNSSTELCDLPQGSSYICELGELIEIDGARYCAMSPAASSCGDGYCREKDGENSENCPEDCGSNDQDLELLDIPYSIFPLHIHPENANEDMYNKLSDLIDLADSYNVKLNLGFQPQWVDMILADPIKTQAVREWQTNGHEIAIEHHGPNHCGWNGYSNLPEETATAIFRQSCGDRYPRYLIYDSENPVSWYGQNDNPYQGTFDDAYERYNQLAEKTVKSGVASMREVDMVFDYDLDALPKDPPYIDVRTSRAIVNKFNGRTTYRLNVRTGYVGSGWQEALAQCLDGASEDVCGFQAHLADYVFDDFAAAKNIWSYFYNIDQDGIKRTTASDIIENYMIPNGRIIEERCGNTVCDDDEYYSNSCPQDCNNQQCNSRNSMEYPGGSIYVSEDSYSDLLVCEVGNPHEIYLLGNSAPSSEEISIEISPDQPLSGYLLGTARPKSDIVVRNDLSEGFIIESLKAKVIYDDNQEIIWEYSGGELYNKLDTEGYLIEILTIGSSSKGGEQIRTLYMSIGAEQENFEIFPPFTTSSYPATDTIGWSKKHILPAGSVAVIAFPIEEILGAEELNVMEISLSGKTDSGENMTINDTAIPFLYESSQSYSLPVEGVWKIMQGRGTTHLANHHRRGIYPYIENGEIIIPSGRYFDVDYNKDDVAGNDMTSGQPIYASIDGTVVEVVRDEHQAHIRTYNSITEEYVHYAHMTTESVIFNEGDYVSQGQLLGELYDWDEYNGEMFPHLHFEVTLAGSQGYGPQGKGVPVVYHNICVKEIGRDAWHFVESGVLDSGFYFKNADGPGGESCLED